MSMKLMVRILEEAALTRPQQAILVAMAENANDDGTRCHPSVDLIAWKAGYKSRNVVDIMRELRAMRVIEVASEATQRRATEYIIRIENAPRKQTFEEWRKANGRHVRSTKSESAQRDLEVQSHVPRGAVSREVQNDEGCNLTSSGVQSHVPEVQSHVENGENARENAPDPVIDPVIEPVNRTSHGLSREREKPKRAKSKSLLPDDFCIGERLVLWGIKAGFTVAEMESQIERFKNNAAMKQHTYADWDAAFQNWMHNARDWGHLNRPTGEARDPPGKSSALRELEEIRAEEQRVREREGRSA